MGNCGCGKKKTGGTGQKWIVEHEGEKRVYSSETDARMAASSQSGARVRPA